MGISTCFFLFYSGEYFIAELIESQDDSHQTVVAEVSNTWKIIMGSSSQQLHDCS